MVSKDRLKLARKIGWVNMTLIHRDYAEIIARRLALNIDLVERFLQSLSGSPREAYVKAVNLGEEALINSVIDFSYTGK